MDKNEVLKILETAKDENGEVPMRLVRQAFEKLSEPCEDAISRQAVFDEAFEVDTKEYGRIDVVGVDAIVALPPVTPQPKTGHLREQARWIPCSKTIDIPDHEVLCCNKYGEEFIGWLSYLDDQWICETYVEMEMMYGIIAWCEKPEPYKERREDDKR